MKFRLRPHSKDESKALNPEKVEKKPLYIHYDKEGNRIGDDGYPLTPKRHRLHNVFVKENPRQKTAEHPD